MSDTSNTSEGRVERSCRSGLLWGYDVEGLRVYKP